MPHMENPSCYRVWSPGINEEIVRLPAFFNLPRFGRIRYQLPLQGALMSDRFATSAKPRSYVVIPARYASTRLPRKMLLRETGKTVLQHTYEAACAARKQS